MLGNADFCHGSAQNSGSVIFVARSAEMDIICDLMVA